MGKCCSRNEDFLINALMIIKSDRQAEHDIHDGGNDGGGENADHPVQAVLPGALAPALIENDGPNGQFFSAIDHKLGQITI